jgi:hypothetical protein
MDRAADIIPIASRRRAQVQVRARPGTTEWGSVRSPWGVAGLIGAGLAFVVAMAASSADFGGGLTKLPAADRAALFQRAMTDVDGACTTPPAREGALRDHCRQQAQFLRRFPECDARCQRLAASILPHARR